MTNFESLVHAINEPRRDFDGRSTIVIERRLHDSVNSVVAALLERGDLFQFDSALAVRSPDGKRPIIVTLPWLESHLREQFRFLDRGKPSLARFVMQRWQIKRPLRSTGGRHAQKIEQDRR